VEAPKRSTPASGGRGRIARGPKRFVTQTTRLESVGDAMDPLGPLGESTSLSPDESFSPQSSGYMPPQSSQGSSSGPVRGSLNNLMSSVNLDDEDDLRSTPGRGPPIVPPSPRASDSQRLNQPSVSVVEAAKPPSFYITVGDPHKVGDLTSAHTEYQVFTKVWSTDGT
jgi:sorting nexin-1/2